MTRRAFLAMPVTGGFMPMLGAGRSNTQRAEGFELTATLQESGDLGYYALGNSCALMLDPDSALLASTKALEGASVVLSLKRAD